MLHQRPKLKPHLTIIDKALDWAALLALITTWLVYLYDYQHSPAIVPTHFDASGKPNNFGSKSQLIALPILATLLYVGLTQLNRYPHLFNYMVEITPENAARQYLIATRLVRCLVLAIQLVFGAIVTLSFMVAIGKMNQLGGWFLPILLAIFLIPTIFAVVKSLQAKKQQQ